MTNAEAFEKRWGKIHRKGAKDLLEWLKETDFFVAPASTRFHGAYKGGLLAHTLHVHEELVGMDAATFSYDEETLAVAALCHDLCKVNLYVPTTKRQRQKDGELVDVTAWEHCDELPLGHGEKSVYLVMRYMVLTKEEALAIRWHMGAYDDAFRGGSRALGEAIDRCPLVLYLHQADMLASQRERRKERLV